MTSHPSLELDDIVAQFLAAAERGPAPDPAEWVARYPDRAAELAAFFADLVQFGNFLGFPAFPNADLTVDYRSPGPEPAPLDAAERRFAGYEVMGEPIGEGGMGIVYRARVVGTSLAVALKQLRTGGGDSASRFREEIEMAAGLRHPNIVPIYHVGARDGRPFFTMALMEGGSLDGQLALYRGNPRAASELVARTARAVHHAHQRRVLHRDLKPSNILLDAGGGPHVADFGLAARLTEAGSTVDAGPPAGSLPWMAPEAVRGDTALTTAVDVWALGVILYELLAGARPFPGPAPAEVRKAILERDPLPVRSVDPKVPRDLDAICRRCLEKGPERRYESASALALELDRWLNDEPVRARRAGRGERFARWCRRNPGLAGGAVFLASMLLAMSAGSLSLAAELEADVVDSACRNSEYDADQVAGNVLQRFERLEEAVRKTAADFEGRPFRLNDRADMEFAVQRLDALVQSPIDRVGGRPFVNAFILDRPGGVIRAFSGDMKANPHGYPGRDYFAAARRETIHVSRVFQSENDGLDKVALSVEFGRGGAGESWVLAATVTTDERLDLGVVSMGDERHTAILVAPRDSAPPRAGADSVPEEFVVLVLVHPALAPRTPTVRFGTDRPGPRTIGNPLELGPAPRDAGRPFESKGDFRDSLAERDPAYAGRWLTGAARVGNTELVVVVQQRYDEAVGLHRSFLRRFLAWIGGAVALGLLSFAGFRMLRSRYAPGRVAEKSSK